MAILATVVAMLPVLPSMASAQEADEGAPAVYRGRFTTDDAGPLPADLILSSIELKLFEDRVEGSMAIGYSALDPNGQAAQGCEVFAVDLDRNPIEGDGTSFSA